MSKLHLDTINYTDANKYEVITMDDKQKQGVTSIYDNKYGKIGEQLFLQNKLMVSQILGGDSLTAGYTYYYNINDTMVPIGSIVYDKFNFNKEQKMCTYFQVEAPDSIMFGESYNIKITGNLGLKNDFGFTLTLGELDTLYRLKEKSKYQSKGKTLNLSIHDYKEGINLLTGQISYKQNGKDITKEYNFSHVDFPLIFYKQFVVTQK